MPIMICNTYSAYRTLEIHLFFYAVSRVPVNLCTNLCYHMQAEGGVRAT